MRPRTWAWRAGAVASLLLPAAPLNAAAPGGLVPCRLKGFEHEALCGQVQRALDPANQGGTRIDVHFAVLPALARNKKPDPVFFIAGGPGQSAIDLAGPLSRMLARFGNRRDIVLVDQRGTGRSAPLMCDEEAASLPLRQSADPAGQVQRARDCLRKLQTLPHGDLRHYTTTLAMADLEAVRQALGAQRINLIGASYGTRAVLDYMRQFPLQVRRAVLDGVAPPDMVLPQASAADAQAAFDALLQACEKDAVCSARHPRLRATWQALLAALPREVSLPHPLTGRSESLTLTRDMLLGMVRAPLYSPAFSAGLPVALEEAAQGRFVPLLGLSSALGPARGSAALAQGMHFSVICAEDMPSMPPPPPPAPDFGEGLAPLYRQVCEGWPRGVVPEAFRVVPTAPAATLLLSGGIDPVTPPRHGECMARSLGAKARHEVVPNAGHGLLGLACLRDVVFRFIDAATDAQALEIDASCARDIPRPPPFLPPGTGAAP
ncbi:MAG TPA: alpha/beta hydrolase [Rubrivivax sp.]|nr:alpha/beta hydrolase [Rubrivivax sp.]